jgi:hypothetical protein
MTNNKSPEQDKVYPNSGSEFGGLSMDHDQTSPSSTEPIIPVSLEIPSLIDEAEIKKPRNIRKYVARTALGLLAVGGVTALATQPGKVLKEIEEAAPITVPGLIGSEVVWDVGLGMMVVGAGKNIGNPLTLRKRWGEVGDKAINSSLTKAGLTINTLGALATTGFIVYGGTKLSPDLWPGVAGVASLDLVSTVALRAPLVLAMKNSSARLSNPADVDKKPEKIRKPSVKVRVATLEDIDRLADIDLQLWRKAYGQDIPPHEEVTEMLKKRYLNNPDWMFVSEVDDKVEGFVSGFRTNTPLEDFVSWEESTANGTLDGKVNPEGKYGYVTNMTIKLEAVKLGAENMLLANLFAKGIESGLEYAYFISRVPSFKRWLKRNEKEPTNDTDLQHLAEEYVETKRRDGTRRDPELRIYEKLGYSLERTVANAFQDDASLNFGVICKAEVPPTNKLKNIKTARLAYATLVRQVARYPRLLEKII